MELMSRLDRADGKPYFRKPFPETLVVKRDDLQATYNLSRGKVIKVTYFQYFWTPKDARRAMDDSKEFLKGRGVFLESLREEPSFEVVRGTGSGLTARLTLTLEPDGRYRMHVGLSCRDN